MIEFMIIIAIIPVIYFYVVIAAVAAVGMELAIFLQKWIVEISIALWLLVAFFAFRSGRKEKDPENKIWTYGMPIALIPILYTVIQSLYDCVLRTGALEGMFLLFFAFPLTFCSIAFGSLGSVWVGSWFQKHTWLGVGVAALGNALIFRFIYNIWGPIG